MFSSHRFNQSPLPIPPIGTERLGPTLLALSLSTKSFTYTIDSFEATITITTTPTPTTALRPLIEEELEGKVILPPIVLPILVLFPRILKEEILRI